MSRSICSPPHALHYSMDMYLDALSYIDEAWEGSPIHLCNEELVRQAIKNGDLAWVDHKIPASPGEIIRKLKKREEKEHERINN
jgi:hypothetical protein